MPRSIIGESFKPYVSKQIELRQLQLGSILKRDPDLLKYLSNKTSWVRLSSGVNVSVEKAQQLGVGAFNGNLLAKKSVLFSARKYETYSTSQGDVINNLADWSGDFTHGLWYDNSNPSYGYTPAIGIGGQDLSKSNPQDLYDYGLTPPPGIKSVDIKALNRGSLREATVEIECHSLAQFRIIEALYLRLKFSVFLEWGHTLWYNNKDNGLQSDMPDYIHQGFLNGNYDQDTLLADLERNRELYCGNYDGYLGYVRNFSWSIRKDGGYDITLNLISIGDVIESLKINTNYPGLISVSSDPNQNNQPPTVANKNKSTLNQILFAIQNEIYNQGYLDGFNSGGRSALFAEEIIRLTKDISKYDLKGFNYKSPDEIGNKANNILTYQEGVKAWFRSISADDENSTGGTFYYIKLGTLLRLIESFLLKYDVTKQDKNGSYKPLFYIDHDFDTNICLTLPRQISTDPRVCLLKPRDPGAAPVDGNATATTQYIKYTYTVVEEEVFGFNNFYWKEEKTTVDANDPTFNEKSVLKTPPVLNFDDQTDVNGQSQNRIVSFSATTSRYHLYRAGEIDNGVSLIFFEKVEGYNDQAQVTTKDSDGNNVRVDNQKILSRTLDSSYRVDEYPFIGKFMHIHVNLDFISKTLSDSIDEEGKMSLYDFLTKIIKGIQEATGQINDFEVVYNDAINTFSIIDNSIIPNGQEYLKKILPDLNIDIVPTPFNINLLKEGEGSFVTDMSIKSELTNAFATQISIGAQSNGNKIGENATAISKLSSGYTDRIITDKSSVIDKGDEETTDAEKSKSPTEVYRENLIAYIDIKNKIDSGIITSDDISNNTQGVVDLLKYELGYYTQLGNIAGVGFIPINLSITFDGLSGPRINESYTINETLLPENYRDNIKFITKGVSHKIDGNGWTTTLESFSAPRADVLKPPVFPKDPIQANSGNSNNNTNNTTGTVTSSNNLYDEAVKYKNYVYELGYKGAKITINRGTNKGQQFNAIDCSGFVNKVLGTNLGSSETTTVKGKNFRQVSSLNVSDLKNGDVIGVDNGSTSFDGGRQYGIDHILIVIQNPSTNKLEIWESNGPSVSKYNDEKSNSYGGVRSTSIENKVAVLNKKSKKIFVSSFKD